MSQDNSQLRLLICLVIQQKLQQVMVKTNLLVHVSMFQEKRIYGT